MFASRKNGLGAHDSAAASWLERGPGYVSSVLRTAPENLYKESASFSITDVSCLLGENLIFEFSVTHSFTFMVLSLFFSL